MICGATMDRNILQLLECGWYVPQRIRLRTVFDLKGLVQQGQEAAAADIIMLFFRKNLTPLESYLVEQHSGQHYIPEAFRAHEKGLYNASVLMLLAFAKCLSGGNLILVRQVTGNNALGRNRSLHNLLGTHFILTGYFSEAERNAVLEANAGTLSARESYRAMALVSFITDFFASVQKPS